MNNRELYFDKVLLERVFIIDPVKEFNFTYESLITNATVLFKGELEDLIPGQKALLISSDVYEIICFVLACWFKKIVPAIISPNLKIEDYESVLKNDYSAITNNVELSERLKIQISSFAIEEQNKTLDSFSFEYSLENIAIVLFSSGTTGGQKAVPLSFHNLISNIHSFKDTLNLSKDSMFLCTSPVWHAHGLYNSLITAFFLKKTVVYSGVLNIFNAPKLLSFSSKCQNIIYHITPSMIPILSSAISRLKLAEKIAFEKVICGTSFLDEKSKLLLEKLLDVELIQQYGMTEVLFISFNDNPKGKPNSVGRPLGIVDLQIWDDGLKGINTVGKIRLKTPSYYGKYLSNEDPKTFLSEGYFVTGDLGYVDEDGYLYISGREKDLIKKGGLSISSAEINALLEEYKGVVKACTLSKTDSNTGEEIYCFVETTSEINISDLKEYLKSKISNKFIPKRIISLKKLPYNEMNKINRKELLKLLDE